MVHYKNDAGGGRNPLGNLRGARARSCLYHFCNLSVPRWRKIAYIYTATRESRFRIYIYIYYIRGVRCHKYAPPCLQPGPGPRQGKRNNIYI